MNQYICVIDKNIFLDYCPLWFWSVFYLLLSTIGERMDRQGKDKDPMINPSKRGFLAINTCVPNRFTLDFLQNGFHMVSASLIAELLLT
jgi:hypothetical protein